MYTLLAGQPPFRGKNELEIVQNIKKGIYDLRVPELVNVSTEGKGLMQQMLKYDPEARISAE